MIQRVEKYNPQLLKEIQTKWPRGPYSIEEATPGVWAIITPKNEQLTWFADKLAAVDYAVILNTAFILGYMEGNIVI